MVVTVPDRAALEGLSKIPGFQVFPLDVSEAFADEAPRASSAAAVVSKASRDLSLSSALATSKEAHWLRFSFFHGRCTQTGHGAPKRKPLPSKDVFYLMMDPK